MEIGAPEGAALGFHKLREGPPGKAAVLGAGKGLVTVRQRIDIHLDHMQAGTDTFEVKHPPIVADHKRTVFKIDPHSFDTVRSFAGIFIAGTGRDPSHQGRSGPQEIVPDRHSGIGCVRSYSGGTWQRRC